MKKEAQKKLLKSIAEVADSLTKGKTCWYGKEAVEAAIMKWLESTLVELWCDDEASFLSDLSMYLPETRPGEDK